MFIPGGLWFQAIGFGFFRHENLPGGEDVKKVERRLKAEEKKILPKEKEVIINSHLLLNCFMKANQQRIWKFINSCLIL